MGSYLRSEHRRVVEASMLSEAVLRNTSNTASSRMLVWKDVASKTGNGGGDPEDEEVWTVCSLCLCKFHMNGL